MGRIFGVQGRVYYISSIADTTPNPNQGTVQLEAAGVGRPKDEHARRLKQKPRHYPAEALCSPWFLGKDLNLRPLDYEPEKSSRLTSCVRCNLLIYLQLRNPFTAS